MGMFDNITVEKDNCFGLLPGDYQTKDLDNQLSDYVIDAQGVIACKPTQSRIFPEQQRVENKTFTENEVTIYAFYSDTESTRPADWAIFHPADSRRYNRGNVEYVLTFVNNQLTKVTSTISAH